MGWIKDFTKKWGLKISFLTYMLSSLIFSIPLGLTCQLILVELKKKYIFSKLLIDSNNFLDKVMLSSLVEKTIDFFPIIIIIVFFYIFFNLFYRDKIQSVIEFLDKHEEVDLDEKNELSDKLFDLISENEKLKKEIFINLRSINDLHKERDMVLHEIKNPLTILSGDIEMLNARFKSEDPRVNRILERMSRSEKRIQDYMNNLKLRENVKDLKVVIKEITYEDFIKKINRELNDWNKEIEFSYKVKDLSKTLKIDMDVFLEGLINIIKNSDIHAKNKIFINVLENNKYLIVEVEDDGPGFSHDALNYYNKPYFTENPLVGNMGLGLYITDKIMKTLDIKMVLTNKMGANTKLFIKTF